MPALRLRLANTLKTLHPLGARVITPGFMRILVAEDEKKVCHFIRKALREGGYAVDTVHDGHQALERALTVAYDVKRLDFSSLPLASSDASACLVCSLPWS